MAKKQKDEEQQGGPGGQGSPEHVELLAELSAAYLLMERPFDAALHGERSVDDLAKELADLQPTVDKLLEMQAQLAELQKAPAAGVTLEPVGRVIILRTKKASHTERVFGRKAEVINGKEYVKPSIMIKFEEVAKGAETFCWDSETMYAVPKHVEEAHGGKDGVLRVVKNWCEQHALTSPGQYQFISAKQHAALLQHPFLREQAVKVINLAVMDPENATYAALLKNIRDLIKETGVASVTSHVVPGPRTVS